MNIFAKVLSTRRSDDRGASIVEYGLLIGLIAIIGMAALGSVGSSTEESFEVVAAGFEPGGVVDPGGAESNGPSEPGQDPDDAADQGTDDQSYETGGNGGAGGSGDVVENGGSGDTEEPTDASDTSDDDGSGAQDPDDQTADDDGGDGQDSGDDQSGDGGAGGETGGEGDDTDPEEPIIPGSTVSQASTGAEYYWWNQTKNGGEGAWKASVSYENTWIRHQYLTLEVTRVDEKGKTTVTTVKDFYVPANGKSTLDLWDNELSVSKGKAKGVVSVSIEVTGIRTSDESWKPVSYPGDGTSSVVEAPEQP